MMRVHNTETNSLALAVALTLAGSAARPGSATALLGQPAPSFRLGMFRSGQTHSLEGLPGRFVVLHFRPAGDRCNAEAPHLKTLQQTYESRGSGADRRRDGKPGGCEGLGGATRVQLPRALDRTARRPRLTRRPTPFRTCPTRVPIASNLIHRPREKIRFYTLLDSANFDARLIALRAHGSTSCWERAMIAPLLLALATAARSPPAVVTVAEPGELRVVAGGRAEARLVVTIEKGFKIQANPASNPFLVPATLELEADRARSPRGSEVPARQALPSARARRATSRSTRVVS
jgi:hypothetical protein